MILTPIGVLAPDLKEFPGANAAMPTGPRRAFALANAAGNKRLRTLTTLTFAGGLSTWYPPATTLKLESLSGIGDPGMPEEGEEPFYSYTATTTTYNSSGAITSGPTSTTGTGPGYAPENYCYGEGTQGSGGSSRTETCYTYTQHGYYNPPTTGASSSAFGQVFPGGVGGPASSVKVEDNILLVPKAPYTINVSSGGSVTISFYE